MRILKFIAPFLFARNWYTGERELSRTRIWLFVGFLVLFGIGTVIIIVLNAPVEYAAPA